MNLAITTLINLLEFWSFGWSFTSQVSSQAHVYVSSLLYQQCKEKAEHLHNWHIEIGVFSQKEMKIHNQISWLIFSLSSQLIDSLQRLKLHHTGGGWY